MSVATETLHSTIKSGLETRKILGPAGNRVRVSEESNRKGLKKPEKPKSLVYENNFSVDSSCSSNSSSNGFSVKIVNSKRRVKHNELKSVKVVPDVVEAAMLTSLVSVPVKRCDWITPYSDPLYTSFHDEEWGVPVYEDRKLFELLVLSQALAELTWPAILNKRGTFRKLFENFDPSSVAKFTEKKLLSLRANGRLLLSEPKLRAVVENANQLLKVQHEFGSFSNYMWRFVNHRPIKNGFCYARQVPAKTPKSELISKDLMRRGFCCVGPTVVYSFMQVAGMVNDHVLTCFSYTECNKDVEKDLPLKFEKTKEPANALENTNLSHD